MTEAQKKKINDMVTAGELSSSDVTLLNVPDDVTLSDRFAQRRREQLWQKVNDPTNAELRDEHKQNVLRTQAESSDGFQAWSQHLRSLYLPRFQVTFVEAAVLAMTMPKLQVVSANLM